MPGNAINGDFSDEQKRYLEGFAAGLNVGRAARQLAAERGSAAPTPITPEPVGPDAAHIRAQNRFLSEGQKLSDPERFKRELHPLDGYERLKEQVANNEPPKPDDNFRWRFFGLFYVAPAQSSYMCRLRIPNGILKHWQFSGVADLAQRHGGAYAHVTTRANLQVREIAPKNAVAVLESILDLGLGSRGSGADNIRNVTGTPTAGIDPLELIDTRPYAREWHFHILNDRGLYGIPRKFNVAFDGAGAIPVLEDTNDIGFQAVRVTNGFDIEPGVWFRLLLGGITGHRDFGRETGVLVKPSEATKVADAVVRVFIDHGDRTNRSRARLKYVLERFGMPNFLTLVEERLGRPLTRMQAQALEPRPSFNRNAHIGIHPQKQEGLNWIGVALPVGKLSVDQMHGLAAIAQEFGDGDIRLTVWQNLLISGVENKYVANAVRRIEGIGLSCRPTAIRAGLVACTGSVGCKFAASDTKGHAEEIARWCEEQRVEVDQPINIHLTGCPNSCAQHYVGDIGLLACKIQETEDSEQIAGYHVLIGGGFGPDATLAREIYRDIKAADVPRVVERLLRTYLAHRASPTESFLAFTRRHDDVAIAQLMRLELAT
jgi:ferredoxin-nitrite reductase